VRLTVSSISLSPGDHNALLAYYRRAADPDVRLRAHILLLLDARFPWATISTVLFCSFSTISRWKGRFEAEGVDAVLGRPRGRRHSPIHSWATLVIQWMLTFAPIDFRFVRSRWSCEAVAVVLREDCGVRVGRETVRLWLRTAGLVWRRPRPTIRPKDPDREQKLRALRALLHGLPDDETAVFMDEVDVILNPKVGCQWMKRGEQVAVETPGTNEKRYLAGSIHWRTGRVFLTEGKPKEGRSAALFLRHLDDLRRAFRHETITDETLASHPSFTHSYTVDIPSFVGGNVGYVGFTGGTGGLTTVADVRTWTYSFTQPSPGGGRLLQGVARAPASAWR
jgi:transposase